MYHGVQNSFSSRKTRGLFVGGSMVHKDFSFGVCTGGRFVESTIRRLYSTIHILLGMFILALLGGSCVVTAGL